MEFFKKHGFLLMFVAVLAAAAYFKYQQISIADELAKQAKIHDEEIKKIDSAREEERALHKRNEDQLKSALDKVEKDWIDAQLQLKEKKNSVTTRVIVDSGGDPNKLAEELSRVTGIRVKK